MNQKILCSLGRALAAAVVLAVFSMPAFAANEAGARKLAERAFPGKQVEAFRKLPNMPFYEIWIARNLVYTDLDAKVLIVGNMLEASSLRNLREDRAHGDQDERFASRERDQNGAR
jgi:hypothetical protein